MSRGSTRATKRYKVETNDGDLISNLPESVVCHILSRLPTKDAVRTSVLSQDWEYKWTSIYNTDINDSEKFSDQRRKKTSFLNFVDRVLLFSNDLRSFRLVCCDKYDSSRLMGFISAAFNRNIESFELLLKKQRDIVLPRSLLNNASLRKLKLASPCTFHVPIANCFPNLVYLYLYEVRIINKLSTSDRVVFTFPVLKTFELVDCKWSNVNLVEIYSPSLSKFRCETPWKAGVGGRSIKICGARLEKFESNGGFPENIILYESTVLNAAFKNYPPRIDLQSCLRVRKLLKGFTSATDLQLLGNICQAIALSKQEYPLPRFDMLQRLVTIYGKAELLLEFLHSAPSLKSVEIQGICSDEEFDWDGVDYVPYCVISRLQEVELTKSSEEPVMCLTKFFLKNGMELKKVYLDDRYFHRSRKIKMVKQLRKFPKASSCVALV